MYGTTGYLLRDFGSVGAPPPGNNYNNTADTRRSPFTEKYVSIVLAMEAGDGSEHSRQSSAYRSGDGTAYTGFLQALEELGCGPHWRELCSEFMSVGDADTLRLPQLFGVITYEAEHLPE